MMNIQTQRDEHSAARQRIVDADKQRFELLVLAKANEIAEHQLKIRVQEELEKSICIYVEKAKIIPAMALMRLGFGEKRLKRFYDILVEEYSSVVEKSAELYIKEAKEKLAKKNIHFN